VSGPARRTPMTPPFGYREAATGRPPTPQPSGPTSRMTTKVKPGGLPGTSTSRSVAPVMSAAFCPASSPRG